MFGVHYDNFFFCPMAKATNSLANDSFANRTNSFHKGTKSAAKRTISIAKTCKIF